MSNSSFLIKLKMSKKDEIITFFYTNTYLQNHLYFFHCISVKFAQCWNLQSFLNELKIAWTGEDDQCWSCSELKSDPSCPPQHISYGSWQLDMISINTPYSFFYKTNEAFRNFHFSCLYWNISSRCFSSTDSAVSEIIGPCTCWNNFAPTKGDSLQKYHQK